MTLKQKLFIKKYFEFGNATEAAMQVYNVKKRSTAAQIAYENLRKHDVISEIEAYFVREDLSPSYVSDRIAKMMVNTAKNGTPTQQLKVCELYLKINGIT